MYGVYILNKIFDGSWNDEEGNISHEIIDFALTDSGKYYVYNVPYGCCPDWIHINGDERDNKETHETDYLFLTSESHGGKFFINYRIKLLKKMHRFSYYRTPDKRPDVAKEMERVYDRNNIFYGGKKISEILDTDTPLVTFEASYIEAPTEPIEVCFSEYNYQRNKGYLKEDAHPNDFKRLQKQIEEKSWTKVGLNPINGNFEDRYNKKTFLDLIFKTESEENYTNMLFSVLSQPGMIESFCRKFAPNRKLQNEKEFKVFREHGVVGGRMDICAESGDQRIVIENKLFSGLNGIKKDATAQLSTYYGWGLEKGRTPLCFLTVPDFRLASSNANRLGDIERDIQNYDPDMCDKYIIVTYSQIREFIKSNIDLIDKEYEYYRYLEDISEAFGNYAYPSKAEYVQSLFQKKIKEN